MANFDPTQYGATPVEDTTSTQPGDMNSSVQTTPTPTGAPNISGFDPSQYGATPFDEVGNPDMNKTAGLLGMTTSANESLMTRLGKGTLGALNSLGQFGNDVSIGIGKSIVDTAHNVADLGGLLPSTPFEDRVQKSADELSQGTTGKALGEGAGNIAQFVAPGPAEEMVAAKAVPFLQRLKGVFGLSKNAVKAGEILSKGTEVGINGAIQATSASGVTAAQGGNSDEIATNALLGGGAGVFAKSLEVFGKGLADSLQKADFKMTPMAAAKAEKKASSAASFMTDNKIFGSESTKYQKLATINDDLETGLQSSLPPKLQINKDAIMTHQNQLLDQLRNTDEAAYNAAKGDVEQAQAILKSRPGESIDVGQALKNKRSWGKDAFKKSKIFDAKVTSEGSFINEQGYQNAINDTLGSTNTLINVPSQLKGMFGGKAAVTLSDFNKVYSNAISAKNLTYLSQFKKDTGLFGRMFGLWAGETAGQAVMPGPIGKIVGGGLGELGSTHLPSTIRNVGERVLGSGNAIPKAAKAGMGINRDSGQTYNDQQ